MICLGFFLFLVDSKMINAQGQSDLQHYYLWSDAILFGLGLFFYLLFVGTQKYQEEKQSVQQFVLLLFSFVLLSWCGAVSAVEYFTHNSVSTLIMGALILAGGIYLRGMVVFLVYGTSLLSFIICKNNLTSAPLNFFTEHINLMGLTLEYLNLFIQKR